MVQQPLLAPTGRAPRVLIVTASMGSGHTEVAVELGRRLGNRGAEADVVDLLTAAGRAGDRLRGTYRGLLRHAPWLYDAAMRTWVRHPRALERITALGNAAFARVVTEAVRATDPDIVVATYNLAGQLLGRLRAAGRIRAPLAVLVTDPGAHPYWVSPQAELHIAPTPGCAAALRRFGAPRVTCAPPLLRPEFDAPPTQRDARSRLDLAATASRTALLTAGSWATGGIDAALDLLAAQPDLCTVLLCGRDEDLLARARTRPHVRAVPWTRDVVDHLAAADVVVDNAGGQTCWEALACGTPVLLYDPLPGHGAINARALDRDGLARHVHSRNDLLWAVAGVQRRTGPARSRLPSGGMDAATQVLALAQVPTGQSGTPS